MNRTLNEEMGWLHALPIVVIAALAITLWRPAADAPPSPEQERTIIDLAAGLGSRPVSADDIDNRLRTLGRFPPDPRASRALASALTACGTASLDQSQRARLARHLYGIAVIGDSRIESVPAALRGIQQTIATTGCPQSAIDEIVRAARDVARVDPTPRQDWW
jgi:hypothetical protein